MQSLCTKVCASTQWEVLPECQASEAIEQHSRFFNGSLWRWIRAFHCLVPEVCFHICILVVERILSGS